MGLHILALIIYLSQSRSNNGLTILTQEDETTPMIIIYNLIITWGTVSQNDAGSKTGALDILLSACFLSTFITFHPYSTPFSYPQKAITNGDHLNINYYTLTYNKINLIYL